MIRGNGEGVPPAGSRISVTLHRRGTSCCYHRKDFRGADVALPEGFSVERLGRRRSLADELAAQRDTWLERSESDPFGQQREKAYSLLLSCRVAHAFEHDDLEEDGADEHDCGKQMQGEQGGIRHDGTVMGTQVAIREL